MTELRQQNMHVLIGWTERPFLKSNRRVSAAIIAFLFSQTTPVCFVITLCVHSRPIPLLVLLLANIIFDNLTNHIGGLVVVVVITS